MGLDRTQIQFRIQQVGREAVAERVQRFDLALLGIAATAQNLRKLAKIFPAPQQTRKA